MQTSYAQRTTLATRLRSCALLQRATRRCLFVVALMIAASTLVTPVFAQTDIVIGNSSPLGGPIGPSNKEAIAGAQAYFDQVNKRGGVNGRKILFIVMDDQQDTKISLEKHPSTD